MTAFRPKTSDTVPANAIATARTPVAADSERLAAAGEIEKPLAHQWLNAVKHRKGREAAEKEGEVDAPEPRAAARDQRRFAGRSSEARER